MIDILGQISGEQSFRGEWEAKQSERVGSGARFERRQCVFDKVKVTWRLDAKLAGHLFVLNHEKIHVAEMFETLIELAEGSELVD
jgi:hypothetical protein